MRVGIDFLFAQQDTTQGYDSALRNLLSGIEVISPAHDILVFCNTPYYQNNHHKFANLELIDCEGRWQSRWQRAVWQSTVLPRLVRQYRLDVMYFATHFRPIQDLKGVRTVFNVYDLQYIYLPENFGRFQRLVRHSFYRLSLAKCDRSICISNYVKRTVHEAFPWLEGDQVVVLPIPVVFEMAGDNLPNINSMYALSSPYILAVGKHFPHKNLETLIRAFAILLRADRYAGSLVVVGSFTAHTPTLYALVNELGIGANVRFLGYVTDVIREALYRGASMVVLPSLYEGFGMPAVEAMGREIPVVCSDTTSLPEVTLNLATYYSPPANAEALAEALMGLLISPPSPSRLHEISSQIRDRYAAPRVAQQYIDLWEVMAAD